MSVAEAVGDTVTITRRNLKKILRVPDILVFTPPPRASAVGVALELKRTGGNGRTSSEQEAWLAALTQAGWAVYVAHGADAAIAWLTSLGY